MSDSLNQAITAMEEHLEYTEATSQEQTGPIWERVFKGTPHNLLSNLRRNSALMRVVLDNYPKCKVFYKEVQEEGPDGEPEKVWHLKSESGVSRPPFSSSLMNRHFSQLITLIAVSNSNARAVSSKKLLDRSTII